MEKTVIVLSISDKNIDPKLVEAAVSDKLNCGTEAFVAKCPVSLGNICNIIFNDIEEPVPASFAESCDEPLDWSEYKFRAERDQDHSR